jgi:hypothetical protein
LPLNGLDAVEYPQIAAHAVAALAASTVIAFIDAETISQSPEVIRADLCGKYVVMDYQSLAQPQVVAIARHPLCGCAF